MWAFRLCPAPQELLSSFLARVAHGHGSTAGAFCRLHLGDSWYWTRDVDRGVAIAQHARLSMLSGLSLVDIERLTLRRWIGALTPSSYRSRAPTAISPWIMAVGIDQARRRHGALAYCPECLACDGVALKAWRLAFHTHCDVHGQPLLDACPRCAAPFVPHLSRRSQHHCFSCGHVLLASERRSGVKQSANEGARQMQARLHAWLEAACEEDEIARHHLRGLRVLLSLCWSGLADVRRIDSAPRQPAHLRLETMGLTHRIAAMQWLNEVVDDWPLSFRRIATETGITQRTFARQGIEGRWLIDEIERLPPGHRRAKVRRADTLLQHLHKPADACGVVANNWRARRALALMQEAYRGL